MLRLSTSYAFTFTASFVAKVNDQRVVHHSRYDILRNTLIFERLKLLNGHMAGLNKVWETHLVKDVRRSLSLPH